MRITWNELTVGFDRNASDALLEEWRWLVPQDAQVFLVSSLGDLFLGDGEERIYWLDAGAARLTQVANSMEEFKRLMPQPDRVKEWFVPQLVGDLMASGKRLAPGECYSYKVPPMLNGRMEVDNFEPTDLMVHCGMLGQIGRKIKDLPEGAKIHGFTVTNEN